MKILKTAILRLAGRKKLLRPCGMCDLLVPIGEVSWQVGEVSGAVKNRFTRRES